MHTLYKVYPACRVILFSVPIPRVTHTYTHTLLPRLLGTEWGAAGAAEDCHKDGARSSSPDPLQWLSRGSPEVSSPDLQSSDEPPELSTATVPPRQRQEQPSDRLQEPSVALPEPKYTEEVSDVERGHVCGA